MGIRLRSILVMGVLGLVTIAIIGATSYRVSVNSALDEARIKSNIILNYAMATKEYMKEVQKPLVKELIEADRFYPELMSGFVSARGTFEFFQKSILATPSNRRPSTHLIPITKLIRQSGK